MSGSRISYWWIESDLVYEKILRLIFFFFTCRHRTLFDVPRFFKTHISVILEKISPTVYSSCEHMFSRNGSQNLRKQRKKLNKKKKFPLYRTFSQTLDFYFIRENFSDDSLKTKSKQKKIHNKHSRNHNNKNSHYSPPVQLKLIRGNLTQLKDVFGAKD